MAKGGKRTYARDSNGRFASTPGSAAKKAAKSTSGRASTLGARTGLKGSRAKLRAKDKADQTLQNTLSTRAQKGAVKRGSRKLAAAKTAAQTRIDGGRKEVIGRPKGRIDGPAKPAPKIDTKKAISRAIQLRNKAKQLSKQAESMMGGGRKDGAIVNMSLNSSARRSGINQAIKGSQLAARAEALNNKADRVLDRAIASRKKAEREVIKPAKKQRSAESLRISRAKQVEKRRSINITNPAGRRQDAAAKMAANAARTQKRALDFYKQKGRAPKAPVPAPKPPTRTKGSRATLPRTPGTVAKPKGLKPGAPKKATNTFRPGQFKRLKTMQGVSYEKPVKKQAKSGTSFRPGEFYRGNFRPRNVTGKPIKGENPFTAGDIAANVKTITRLTESRGKIKASAGRLRKGRAAEFRVLDRKGNLAPNIVFSKIDLEDPRSSSVRHRRSGHYSTSSPLGTMWHELGHAKHNRVTKRKLSNNEINTMQKPFYAMDRSGGSMLGRKLANRVSKYAAENPDEFVAEVYAGVKTGRKYDHEVMSLYRKLSGFNHQTLKNQKPRRRKPKP